MSIAEGDAAPWAIDRAVIPACEVVTPDTVHKKVADNVWLERAREGRPDALTIKYRIPANTSAPRFADLLEVQRQAGILFAHRCLKVPSDHVFVLAAISLRGAWRGALLEPSSQVGWITVTRSTVIGCRVQGSTGFDFRLGEENEIARGTASARFIPRAVYKRMRRVSTAGGLSPEIPSAGGGSVHTRDFNARVENKSADVLVSDHESDHISAMGVVLSIEKELTRPDAGLRLDALSLDFYSYLDRAEESCLAMSVTGGGALAGEVLQRGRVGVRFRGNVTS